MRSLLLAAATLILASLPAGAQEMSSLFQSSEVLRSQMHGSGDIRYDVWKFSAGGSYAGSFSIDHWGAARGGYAEEGLSSGRWRIDGETLCLAEAMDGRTGETCFTMTRTRRSEFYVGFRGTEVGTDRAWVFQVFPARWNKG